MTLSDWITTSRYRVCEDGLEGVIESARDLYIGGLRRTEPISQSGINIFEHDWDALILLDACRVDLLEEVATNYEFLNHPGTLHSVGSSSIQWIEQTFSTEYRDEMQGTVYVTGNPFSKRVLTSSDLLALDEVWRYAWDDETGTISPDSITDRAIAAGREHGFDRLIVHYMQPHFPSIPDTLSGGMNSETLGEGDGWDSPWSMLRRGDLSEETVWKSYRKNLDYVLKRVQTLLSNLDAQTVYISADHANARGEFGVYGHPKVPLNVLRTVPWYRTRAQDEGEVEPELEPRTQDGSATEKLESLGYL